MSQALTQRLLRELEQIPLIDPHSHIDPRAPAARTLADILGYHYYTELAHSAGLPREAIEEPGLAPRDKVARLAGYLAHLENTVQYEWLLQMCRRFFGFEAPRIDRHNWEELYERAAGVLSAPDWEDRVFAQSGLEAVFLTNDFDDALQDINTARYIPCLRTDDLVFRLPQPAVRQRLERATGFAPTDAPSLARALAELFARFVAHGARACAISLPPDFAPRPVDRLSVEPILAALPSGRELSADEAGTLSGFVFWKLAECCHEFRLPFDLMIGVNRAVYAGGVHQGRDLFDSRVSLTQYSRLFNSFPGVTFPVSVLAHGANQELVSFSWIFPNVVTCGHWWYSNIPAYIEFDCRSRLEAVPQTKQIGYYSDMYKLEFALPKFNMYRRVLAGVLARNFVMERDWPEERAVALGRAVLRDNVERVFPAAKPQVAARGGQAVESGCGVAGAAGSAAD